jgi:FAD/FMN-containing dehydrogenase
MSDSSFLRTSEAVPLIDVPSGDTGPASARHRQGAADRHARKVERIATALRQRKATTPVSLRKRAVSHEVPRPNDLRYYDETIDISDLNEVLDIDVARRECTAEAGVTFVDLVTATLPHGLVPIIVPELKTITIGGAVAGCSIESASFREGGFHDTCLEYEVVTARGEVLTCSPTENELVFQMMHGTFGTLGVLTRLRFRLMPATPFVHVTYEKCATLAAYKTAIQRHFERQDVQLMDGIIHSPTEWVLSTADFVDRAPYTNRYDWMKVYYRSTRERTEDYLRTPQYFFRYDRGVTTVRPRTAVGRFFLGPYLGSTPILRLARRLHWLLPKEKPMITLDVFLPFSRVEAFFEWYDRDVGHYPLWCVPYKRVRDYEWVADSFFRGMQDGLFLDLAIYGMKQHGERNLYRVIEEKLAEIGGIKTLISYNYYSEDEFWRTWNKPNYDRVKARMDPDNIFRTLWEKTCRTSMGLR